MREVRKVGRVGLGGEREGKVGEGGSEVGEGRLPKRGLPLDLDPAHPLEHRR